MFLPAKIFPPNLYWLVVSPLPILSAGRPFFPERHRAIYRSFGRKATPKSAQEAERTK
jgi:hypothetical protein